MILETQSYPQMEAAIRANLRSYDKKGLEGFAHKLATKQTKNGGDFEASYDEFLRYLKRLKNELESPPPPLLEN